MSGGAPPPPATEAVQRRFPAGRAFGVLLVLAGFVATIYRFGIGLGGSTHLRDDVPWGLWIGLDFTLIAVSGGAFTVAAMVYLLRLERFRPVLRPALLTGWLGYLSVMAILVVDLGRPDRFWGFLVYFNPHSPLFEVSWCVLLYTAVLTLEVWPVFGRRLKIPLVIAGVTLSTMHQSTLGTLFLAMPERLDPLWHTRLLPVLYFVSAVGMGLSTVMLVSLAGARALRHRVPRDVLDGLARASVWVWGIYLALVAGRLTWTGLWPAALAFDRLSVAFLLEFGLGVVAPLVLFARRRALPAAALLVLAGVTLNRFNATLTGQRTPPGSSAYVPHWLEFLIQAGVLAAAVLAYTTLIRRSREHPTASVSV